MKAMTSEGVPAPARTHAGPRRLALDHAAQEVRRPRRSVFGLPLIASIIGLIVGGVILFQNQADSLAVPTLALLALSLAAALVDRRRRSDSWDRAALLVTGLCIGAAAVLLMLPEWMYGWQINGIIHRSALSGPALLLVSALTAACALRGLLGNTPTGQDLSVYPVLILPVAIAAVGYGLILGQVLISGLGGLRLDLLTTAWQQGGTTTTGPQLGFLNNILGTLLLVVMTCLIAILPGVGAGVFMSEYPGRLARLIDFCTTMLRSVAGFIIGAAAFGVVHLVSDQAAGTPLSDLIRGSYQDAGGIHPAKGSFLTASFFLALLVIPAIAKVTEEGLRSVPREIREGSVALGATEGYGLRRILLPWAVPNILTGLLLAAAEASGSLAVIMFIAGTGERGVGPLNEVTSLDYAVFATAYGPRAYFDTMRDYRFTAALLLLVVTLGLTVIAMLLRRRFAGRYRGALTAA